MTVTKIPVRRLADVRTGKIVNRAPSAPSDVEAPYVTAANVQPLGRMIEVEGKTMWFSPKELHGAAGIRTDDVLVVEGGAGYGRPAIVPPNFEGRGFQNHLNRVRPIKDAADARYLYYAFEDLLASGVTGMVAQGATIPTLSSEKVRSMQVPFHPLPEQRAIADFLGRETAQVDAMIEAQRELVAALEERRRAIVGDALLLTPSGTDRSAGWLAGSPHQVERLGLNTRATNGSTPSRDNLGYWDGDYPWLNSSVVNQPYVDEATERVSELALRECHLPKVPAGALLVAITGQGKTRGMVTELRIGATINQHLAAIVPSKAHWDRRFLLHVLSGAYGELRRMSDEAGSTRGAITVEDLKKFRVPRPPVDQQVVLRIEFEKVAARIEAMIDAANESIALMLERRSALISAAVTGRVDPRSGREYRQEEL